MTTQIRQVEARGLAFTCRQAGDHGGEPVLLLHGFPETSAMWEPLLADLAGAGYHAVAPDQRGYSPGARPADVSAYSYRDLAGDVSALAQALGWERFHLVGHDWGAIVGWAVLGVDARPVQSWTALSVPHYGAFARAVQDDPDEQMYRDLLGLFLTEGMAEEAMGGNDLAGLRAAWSTAAPEQEGAYAEVLGQPGALTAALNWYRACRGHKGALEEDAALFGPVDTPTLLLWGADDPYVRRAAFDAAAPLMNATGGHGVANRYPMSSRVGVSSGGGSGAGWSPPAGRPGR